MIDANIEKLIIGNIISEQNAILQISGTISADYFNDPPASLIYQAAKQLHDEIFTIDIHTVKNRCAQIDPKIDIMPYAIDAQIAAVGFDKIEDYAKILVAQHRRREINILGRSLIKSALDTTADENTIIADAEAAIFKLNTLNNHNKVRRLHEVAVDAHTTIKSIIDRGDGITGITSGFRELNHITAGWQNSDLIIIAARPGMGKSAFCLALAKNAAIADKHCVIFSLEMTSQQIATRLIAGNSNVEAHKLRNAQLTTEEWKRIDNSVAATRSSKIHLDDTPGLSISELRTKLLKMRRAGTLDIAIIDYLQLMTIKDSNIKNREQEISAISRALKGIAKELNIPIIALAQLSRAVESRGDKRPLLSDLRESGAIEQDADIVSFLYRHGYYDRDSDPNLTELIIAKNRHGSLSTVYLTFQGALYQFTEPEVSFNRAGAQYSRSFNDAF
jgi:replicative DNA helicase